MFAQKARDSGIGGFLSSATVSYSDHPKDFIKRIVIAYACQSRGVCGQGHGGQWSAVDTEAACQFGSKMLAVCCGSTVSAKQQLAPALECMACLFCGRQYRLVQGSQLGQQPLKFIDIFKEG